MSSDNPPPLFPNHPPPPSVSDKTTKNPVCPLRPLTSWARTTILGHNFSAPFYISPCARADYAHPGAEANLIKGAAAANILYAVSSL